MREDWSPPHTFINLTKKESIMETTTYLITTTRTKVAEVPAVPAQHVRIETRVRKPESKAYTVDIPTSAMPDTSDVPAQYRALVDSALTECAEAVLNTFTTSKATAGNPNIPTALFTLDSLLQASAQRRMTAAMLLGMWKSSSKYVLDVAPKLTSYTGSALLRYQANIERHEKRLAALCGRSPETALSASDLDKLLVNLSADDEATPFGSYIADRTEEIRAKLVEDSDAL
jgi:hypothetical protein